MDREQHQRIARRGPALARRPANSPLIRPTKPLASLLVAATAMLAAAPAPPTATPPTATTATPSQSAAASVLVLLPERLLEVESGTSHTGWVLRVEGDRIAAVGPLAEV